MLNPNPSSTLKEKVTISNFNLEKPEELERFLQASTRDPQAKTTKHFLNYTQWKK